MFAKIRPNILNNSSTEPLYGVILNIGVGGGEFVFYSPGPESNSKNEEEKELSVIIVNQENKEVRSIISSENKILNTPKRLDIINFEYSSGKTSEYGDLGGPMRDMFTTDLTEVKNLSMVDRQALRKLLNEQNLNNSKSFDQSTATKIGELLGAEVIIKGTYFEFFGSLRVDAKFINFETG